MTDQIKCFLVFMVLSFNYLPAMGQIIENYDPQLGIEERTDVYTSPAMAKAVVDFEEFPLVDMGITVSANTSVFIDGVMWFFTEVDTSFTMSLHELRKKFPSTKSSRELVFYKKGLKKGEISIQKGIFRGNMVSNPAEENPNTSNTRVKPIMDGFFLVAALIVFSLVSLFKIIYPFVISFIIRPVSVFSVEDFSESNSLTKFFSEEILFFLLIFNMLLMLLIMVIVHYFGWAGLEGLLLGDLNHLYFIWLSGTGVLLVLSWIRFVWLKASAAIFGINKFEFTHFFYMLRIVSVILMIIFAILFVSMVNEVSSMKDLIYYLLVTFFVVYFLGILILFYIMTKKVSFKNYHLFSYLCTAELVPFLVLSKLIIG